MNKRKALLLGTAPDSEVFSSLEFLSSPNREIHLLINRSRKHHFENCDVKIHTVKDRVAWFHFSLLLLFLRLRPQEIIFLRGEHWFHDNVVTTIRFWLNFNSSPMVWCLQSGSVDVSFRMPNQSSLVSLLYLSTIFGWCMVVWVLPWLGFSILLLILALEILLFLYDDFIAAEVRRTHMTPNPKNQEHLQAMPHARLGWQGLPKPAQGSESDQSTAKISLCLDSLSLGSSPDDGEQLDRQLQEQFPANAVQQFGAPAWSLYQILLQLEINLNRGVLVLGIHQELLWRHTNSYKARHFDLTYHRNPACVMKGEKPRFYPPKGYVLFPFRGNLRIFKVAEHLYNRLSNMGRGNSDLMLHTSEYLLCRIKDICEQRGCQLLLVCMGDVNGLRSFLTRHRFDWIISEDGDLHLMIEDAIHKLQSGTGVFPKAHHLLS